MLSPAHSQKRQHFSWTWLVDVGINQALKWGFFGILEWERSRRCCCSLCLAPGAQQPSRWSTVVKPLPASHSRNSGVSNRQGALLAAAPLFSQSTGRVGTAAPCTLQRPWSQEDREPYPQLGSSQSPEGVKQTYRNFPRSDFYLIVAGWFFSWNGHFCSERNTSSFCQKSSSSPRRNLES